MNDKLRAELEKMMASMKKDVIINEEVMDDLQAGKLANQRKLEEDYKKAPEKQLSGKVLKQFRAAVQAKKDLNLLSMAKEATLRQTQFNVACNKALELIDKIEHVESDMNQLPNFPSYNGGRLAMRIQRNGFQLELRQLLLVILKTNPDKQA